MSRWFAKAMKRCAPPLSAISYQVISYRGGKALQRESRSSGAVINPSGLRTRTNVSGSSRMRGRDRSEEDWHNSGGACVPTGENFVFLTWNKQGGKSASG